MALGARQLRAILLGLAVAIAALLTWQYGLNFFHSFDIEKIGTVKAPDQSAVLEHCRSRTDTRPDHHAPYGDHVFFRQARFPAPDCNGALIFAGYCQDLTMSWTTAREIELVCTGTEEVNTLASVVRGNRVTLRTISPDVNIKSLENSEIKSTLPAHGE